MGEFSFSGNSLDRADAMQKPPHILVIDDEAMTGDLIARALESYRVSVALDGEEARTIIREDPPDVLMLDIMLPDHDGLALLSDFRTENPLTPVIIITAYSSRERIIRALRDGAYDFLEKPTGLRSIQESVKRALDYRRQMEEEAARLARLEQGMSELIQAHRTLSARENIALVRQIAQGLAHEINNPLCAIRLSAELIDRTQELSASNQEHIEIIQKATRRLEETMNALRMLSFVSEDVQTITVGELIGIAVDRTRALGGLDDCEVSIALPEENIVLETRPSQIGQAIENILHNAVEAMKRAGVVDRRIWITAEVYGDRLYLAIRNVGPGIPSDELEHIFDPTYTTKQEEGRVRGLGLGLYVARSVVEANQGQLRIHSQEGEGVTVALVLPLRLSR